LSIKTLDYQKILGWQVMTVNDEQNYISSNE